MSEIPLYRSTSFATSCPPPRATVHEYFAKRRTDRFWCTFLFLKNVDRPFFENVLRNKNVPPTVFRMPASYARYPCRALCRGLHRKAPGICLL